MTGQDTESPGGVGEHMHSASLSQGAHREVSIRHKRPHGAHRGLLKNASLLESWQKTEAGGCLAHFPTTVAGPGQPAVT